MTIGKRYAAALEASCGALASAYHYETALPLLWSEDPDTALGLADRPADASIVLVTDWTQATERDASLLQKHLTPLDWALSYSLKKAKAGEPMRSIVIFDLTAAKWTATWAWRMRHQLLADMPWVQLVAPIPPSIGRAAHGWAIDVRSVKGKSALKQISSGAWTLDLTDIELPGSSEGETATLTELHRLWIASLNLSDEQHDVNNVVGARLLLGGAASASDQPLIQALLRRLAWCQPIEIARAGQWGEWPGVAKITEKLFNNPLAVVVIDDKIDHGWDRVLGRLFGVDADYAATKSDGRSLVLFGRRRTAPSIFLCGSHLPDPLIDLLSEAKFDCRDFTMQVSPVGEAIPEIIFLDLRLYARPNEKAAAKRLLEILARDELKDAAKLAWRAVEQDELDAIKAWAEDETRQDDRIAMDALLLLPRLLAQAMPLTPIILFSSTGQARVRDKLKFYRNIFTGFEKPRPFGNTASAADALSALTAALEMAVPMLRLRLQLAHAQNAIKIAQDERPSPSVATHYEVFVEETLKPRQGIFSGALLLEYDNIEIANELQKKLRKEYYSAGVSWTKRKGFDDPRLRKTSIINASKGKISYEGQVNTLCIFLDSLGILPSSRSNWSHLSTATPAFDPDVEAARTGLERFGDKDLDVAIVNNVSFFLFSYIPYICDGIPKCSVFLPTRSLIFKNIDTASTLEDSFGLDYEEVADKGEGAHKIRTYGKDSGFALLRGELRRWGNKAVSIRENILSIKSQTISPPDGFATGKTTYFKFMHEMADWTCAAGRTIGSDRDETFRKILIDKKLVPNWLISKPTDVGNEDIISFKELIEANRLLYMSMAGSSSQAFVCFLAQVPYVRDCEKRLVEPFDIYLKQHRIILWSMRAAISGATGETLQAAVGQTVG